MHRLSLASLQPLPLDKYKYNTRVQLCNHPIITFNPPDDHKEAGNDKVFLKSVGMIYIHPKNKDEVFRVEHYGSKAIEIWAAKDQFIDDYQTWGHSKTEFALYKSLFMAKREIEPELFAKTEAIFSRFNTFPVSLSLLACLVFVYVLYVVRPPWVATHESEMTTMRGAWSDTTTVMFDIPSAPRPLTSPFPSSPPPPPSHQQQQQQQQQEEEQHNNKSNKSKRATHTHTHTHPHALASPFLPRPPTATRQPQHKTTQAIVSGQIFREDDEMNPLYAGRWQQYPGKFFLDDSPVRDVHLGILDLGALSKGVMKVTGDKKVARTKIHAIAHVGDFMSYQNNKLVYHTKNKTDLFVLVMREIVPQIHTPLHVFSLSLSLSLLSLFSLSLGVSRGKEPPQVTDPPPLLFLALSLSLSLLLCVCVCCFFSRVFSRVFFARVFFACLFRTSTHTRTGINEK